MKTFVSTWKKMNKPGFGPGFSKTLLLLFVMVSLLNAGCRKDIQEPKHKNKGKNVIYLKIDEQEFLIKEGFSLNRNVIRADIEGSQGDRNPTFYQYDYFGRTASSLSFLIDAKSKSENLGKCNWDVTFFEDGSPGQGLSQGIMVNFYSERHKKWVTIYEIGNGWKGEFSPKVSIIEHDKENGVISGTEEFQYKDLSDTTKIGTYYMYFKLNYK